MLTNNSKVILSIELPDNKTKEKLIEFLKSNITKIDGCTGIAFYPNLNTIILNKPQSYVSQESYDNLKYKGD